MDMIDIARAAPVGADRPSIAQAPELVAQLGREVAIALSGALERVNALATTGRIDRSGLRALREEIELARRVGIMGQQVGRLASGRVRLAHERVDLTALLREALVQRGRELEARGLPVRQTLQPVAVQSDATLTFSLLQTLLDWSFEHARSRIDLALDVQPWPTLARLVCSFAFGAADELHSHPGALDPETPATLESMSWRLLEQTAATLGLNVRRAEHGPRTQATIEFPRVANEALEGASAVELEAGDPLQLNSQPLAGSHVLVLAPTRELRNLVREALRGMGLVVDYTASVDEAREFCRGGMPHAIVYEGAVGGASIEALRDELSASVPSLAFIRLADEGKAFEVLSIGSRQLTSVGRDAIVGSLPSALMFELARCH